MVPSLSLRCLLILVLAGIGQNAWARIGQALVQEQRGNPGTPCFTITEQEQARSGAPQFDTIKVVDVAARAKLMWTMAMPGERTFPVSFRMCIPYAGRLPVLPQTKALALQPGRLYEVQIAVRKDPSAQAARAYRARFCLIQSAGAPVQVQPDQC